MSSTLEVAHVYAMNGAYLVAGAATRTLGIINGGKVVLYFDCSLGTILLAFTASYTSVGANFAHLSALVVTVTLHHNSRNVIYKMDYSVRTGFCTKTASNTLPGVNLRNALLAVYAYRISGTNPHTVAVTKTGKGAISVA